MNLPTDPAISLLGVYPGLGNENDAMRADCLDRKEVRCMTWRMHTTTRPVGALHRTSFSGICESSQHRPL